MTNFFDTLYSSIPIKQNWLDKVRLYSVLRFLTRSVANIILPLYFKCTANRKHNKLPNCPKNEGRYIISLTSFPARIEKVWLVIETILRQTHKPDLIILWLSKEQFPTIDTLPKNLLRMQKRGLQIELREGDLRSHKKYYYTLLEYPNDTLITIDDDIFYHTQLIEHLVNTSLQHPTSICCNHTHFIPSDSKLLTTYSKWEHNNTINNIPLANLLPVGIGGVLYPIGSLHKQVLNKDNFMSVAPRADDIWLKAMGVLNNTLVVQTPYHSIYLPIQNIKNESLSSTNIKSGNNIQIAAVRQYCITAFTKDPFEYLL